MPLQTHKGYYVDYRLKQFRSCVPFPEVIEFVDFDSEKGDALLAEMIEKDLVPRHMLCRCEYCGKLTPLHKIGRNGYGKMVCDDCD